MKWSAKVSENIFGTHKKLLNSVKARTESASTLHYERYVTKHRVWNKNETTNILKYQNNDTQHYKIALDESKRDEEKSCP